MSGGARPRPADALRDSLVRSVGANVLGRILSMAGWLMVTPIVLRHLGASRFGFWSLLTTLTGFSLTLDLGLSTGVTRFIAAHRAAGEDEAMRGALTLGVAGSALLGALWLGVATLLPGAVLGLANVRGALAVEAAPALAVMGMAFLLNLVALVFSAALAGFQRFDLVNRNLVISTFVQLGAIAIVLVRGGGLRELAAAASVGSAVSVSLTWRLLRQVWPQAALGRPTRVRGLLGSFSRFGAALQVINLGVLALFQMPKFLFARMLSIDSVGQYELGYRLAFSAWSLPTLLLPPLLPAASHLQATGESESIRRLYARATRYLLASAFPIAAGLVALARPLYCAWLGPGHVLESHAHAAIMAVLGFNVLTSAGCMLARGMGRPWWEAGYLALAFGLQLPLGIWMIHARGFDGGLLAMGVAGLAGTATFLVVFHRAIGEPLGRFVRAVVLPPFAAAVLGGAAAWVASGAPWGDPATWTRSQAGLSLLAGGGALAVVSGAALLATRALTWPEIRELARLIGRAPSETGADA